MDRIRLTATMLFAAFLAAGCGGSDRGQPSSPAAAGPAPTFTKDIAPIVFTNCAPCHRPGQAAPFTLLTYGDVKSRAAKIVSATKSHRMPAWLPDLDDAPTFEGERRLSAGQIATIER